MDLDFGSSLADSDLGEDFIRRRSRSEYGRTRRESGDVWGWKGARQRSVSRLSQRPEKERMARIERENHILLQKILDCHLGVDRKRTSKIPQSRGRYSGSPTKRSSNQINSSESKKKTDYENLLLLKKILGAKPSKYVRESFSVGNEAI